MYIKRAVLELGSMLRPGTGEGEETRAAALRDQRGLINSHVDDEPLVAPSATKRFGWEAAKFLIAVSERLIRSPCKNSEGLRSRFQIARDRELSEITDHVGQ